MPSPVTATVPVYNLELAVRKRRLRYLGHVGLLRLPAESIVRRSSSSSSSDTVQGSVLLPHYRTLEVRPGRIS